MTKVQLIEEYKSSYKLVNFGKDEEELNKKLQETVARLRLKTTRKAQVLKELTALQESVNLEDNDDDSSETEGDSSSEDEQYDDTSWPKFQKEDNENFEKYKNAPDNGREQSKQNYKTFLKENVEKVADVNEDTIEDYFELDRNKSYSEWNDNPYSSGEEEESNEINPEELFLSYLQENDDDKKGEIFIDLQDIIEEDRKQLPSNLGQYKSWAEVLEAAENDGSPANSKKSTKKSTKKRKASSAGSSKKKRSKPTTKKMPKQKKCPKGSRRDTRKTSKTRGKCIDKDGKVVPEK